MKTSVKTTLTLFSVGIAATLFSFIQKENSKRYGGSASVTVEVDFASTIGTQNNGYVLALKQQGIKDGQRRVVEVSTSCTNATQADAQSKLQSEIKSATQRYEKTLSSIKYNISSCED